MLVFLFVLSMCLFVYAQSGSMAPDAAISGLPEWLVVAMRASYKATTLLTMLFVVVLFACLGYSPVCLILKMVPFVCFLYAVYGKF